MATVFTSRESPRQGDNLLENMQGKRLYFSSQKGISSMNALQGDKKKVIREFSMEPQGLPLKISQKQRRSGFIQLKSVWKSGVFTIIFYITRFLQVLKQSTFQQRFKLLSKSMIRLIGDQTSNYSYYYHNKMLRQKPNRFSVIVRFLTSRILKQVFGKFVVKLMQPDSLLRVYFDILLLIFMVINIFYVPMKFGFNLHNSMNAGAILFLEFIPNILYIVDIILNFNTSYYKKGILHQSRGKIFKNYLYGNFFWDIIVLLPSILHIFKIDYLDLVQILRIRRIYLIISQTEEYTSIRERYSTQIDLSKLLFLLIYMNHFCGCGWHYIGQLQMDEGQQSWLTKYNWENYDLKDRYILSFYWSTVTTLTVGFGDICPISQDERIYVSCVILITSIVYGFTITSIGEIFQQIQQRKKEFKDKMSMISIYLKKRNLDGQLQRKVKKYFEYYFLNIMDRNSESENLMKLLNKKLERDIKKDIHRKTLKMCSLFQQKFTSSFLDDLCEKIQIKRFNPGDIVNEENRITTHLQIILSGQIDILVRYGSTTNQNKQKGNETKRLCSLRKESVIELKNFLLQQKSQLIGKSHGFSEVALLSFDDFMMVLRDHPKDQQTFFVLKENILHNSSFKLVIDFCSVCKGNHQVNQCQFIFYQANRQKILNEYKKSEEQIRDHSKRRYQRSKNTLNFASYLSENVVSFGVKQGIYNLDDMSEGYQEKLGVNIGSLYEPYDDENTFDKQPSLSVIQMNTLKLERKSILTNKGQGTPNNKRQSVRASFNQPQEINIAINIPPNIRSLEPKGSVSPEPKNSILARKSLLQTQSQLEMILFTFIQRIKEDGLPELDIQRTFDHYFTTWNIHHIIRRIKRMKELETKNYKVSFKRSKLRIKHLQEIKFK